MKTLPEGGAFNPYVLHAIRIPLVVMFDASLSLGAKALYGVLAFHLGKPKPEGNFCCVDPAKLALKMGVAEDTVKRWRDELVSRHYGKVVRRGPRPPEWIFLPLNDEAKMPNQDGAGLPHQQQRVGKFASSRVGIFTPHDEAFLPRAYKEENVQENVQEKTSSSTEDEAGSLQEQSTDDELSLSKNPKPPQEWWMDADLEYASDRLSKSRGFSADTVITKKILAHFDELDHFDTWMADTEKRALKQRAKNPGFGLYLQDAQARAEGIRQQLSEAKAQQRAEEQRMTTPMRLAEAIQTLEAHRRANGATTPQVNGELADHLHELGIVEISPEDLRAEERTWKAGQCPRCGHRGLTGAAAKKTLAFCSCQWGEALRAKNPGFVDEQIAAADNLTARLEHAAVEMGKMFTADGILNSKITETEYTITVDVPSEFDISISDEDLRAIFKAAGETRELVVIRQREIERERKHNEFIASLKPRCRCGGTTGLVESQVRRGTWALCECGRATQEQVRECNKRARLGATGFTVGSETQARALGTESA